MDISKILPLIMALNNNENKNNAITTILPELLKASNNNQSPINSMLLNMLSNNFNNNLKQNGSSFQNASKGVATPYPQNNYVSPFSNNQSPAEPPNVNNFPPHMDVNSNKTATNPNNPQGINIFPNSNLQSAQNTNENNLDLNQSTMPTNQTSETNNTSNLETGKQNNNVNNKNINSENQPTKKEEYPPENSAFGYKRVY